MTDNQDKMDEIIWGSKETADKTRKLEKALAEMVCENEHENSVATDHMYMIDYSRLPTVAFVVLYDYVCCKQFAERLNTKFEETMKSL